jgi:hypothetical protein
MSEDQELDATMANLCGNRSNADLLAIYGPRALASPAGG